MGTRNFWVGACLAWVLVAESLAAAGETPAGMVRVGLSVATAPQFPELGRKFEVRAGSSHETLRGPLTVTNHPPQMAAQVGVFAKEANARALRVQLHRLGFAATVRGGGGLYRVLVEVPPAVASWQLKAQLEAKGFSVVWVPTGRGFVEVLGGEGGVVRGETVEVLPLDPPPVVVGERRYRGGFLCVPGEASPLVVNVVPLEDYLLGVVPAEMGPKSFPHLEALKAQAVAARSYAIAALGTHRGQGFDLCDQEHCQVYLGVDHEDPLATQAVHETQGEVLTFGGTVARAYFHSTCGGHTEEGFRVFANEHAPYLRGVPCFGEVVRWSGGGTIRPLTEAERAQFLAQRLAGERPVASPLEFAQALGRGDARTLQEAFLFPDWSPLVSPGSTQRQLLGSFVARFGCLAPDPWTEVLQLAQVAGAVRVQEGVLVAGEDGPRWRESRGNTEVPVGQLAVLWRAEAEAWVGGGETLAGSLARLWCTARGCPVVEVVVTPSADSRSSYRSWIREWDGARLATELGVPEVQVVEVTGRTPSGRAASVRVRGPWGSQGFSGVDLRRLLGLPSTWFVVTPSPGEGALRFRFYGKGWGHGVGLCQNGAYGLSLGGWNYRRILEHYYPGTEVVRWSFGTKEGRV